MKTTRIAALAALAMIAAGNALASDIEINITGKVENTTCQVNSTAGLYVRAVALETVTTNALSQAGKTAGRKDETFDITGCEASRTGVTLQFDNKENYSADGRLINTASGGASNVEIQLLNGNAPVNLNTDAPAFVVSNGAAQLPLAFQYYATGAATQGDVTSQLMISLIYK